MVAEYWYRCNHCGYMYTPQQVQAIVQLNASRSGGAGVEAGTPPDQIRCRKKGCDGIVLKTDSVFREGR